MRDSKHTEKPFLRWRACFKTAEGSIKPPKCNLLKTQRAVKQGVISARLFVFDLPILVDRVPLA